jgi:hypothetical protein
MVSRSWYPLKQHTALCSGLCLVCFFIISGVFPTLEAVVVRPVNLAYLTDSARTVFSGVCTARDLHYDTILDREVYLYTFEVHKMIKGIPRRSITVKTSKALVDLGQIPVYEPGEEVVLFLTGKSRIGFQSPVGLGQGKFSVITAGDGTKSVMNQWGNRNLFRGMDGITRTDAFCRSPARKMLGRVLTVRSGPVDYGRFLDLVEILLDTRSGRSGGGP